MAAKAKKSNEKEEPKKATSKKATASSKEEPKKAVAPKTVEKSEKVKTETKKSEKDSKKNEDVKKVPAKAAPKPSAKKEAVKTEPKEAPKKVPAKATKEDAKKATAKPVAKATSKKAIAKPAPEKVEQAEPDPTLTAEEHIKSAFPDNTEPVTKKVTAKKAEPKEEKPTEEELRQNVKSKEPLVHYSDEELDEFRTIIMDSRQEALDELRMLNERLEDLTNYDFAEESMIYSMHMAEQGSEAMEKEKTYAQIQRIKDYIKKLDEALMRIKDKTYGICRVCGILIAKERLKAVPVTTLSAAYKIHQKCPEDGYDRIEPVKNAPAE